MSILSVEKLGVVMQDKVILQDCSFETEAGKFIGIIGPNGSGKTTFLKAVRGLIPYTSGRVYLYGQDIAGMKEKAIARKLAYMQQSVEVRFGYTAEEIVMTARYPYLKWWQNEGSSDKELVERAMRFAGVWHLRKSRINEVSGGERQRIFLAKALAQETDILFLDEPTAALDLVYADEIFRYCSTLCRNGKTIVLVVHDLEMAAKFCDRLLLFSKGQIIRDGAPDDVLTADNLAKAFHLSSTVYDDPYFSQRRIFIYPNGTERAESYCRSGKGLPERSSTVILKEHL